MERLLTLYSEVQSTDVRWLWYPFIAIGKITLLQGDPGDGKTTLVLNIAAKLSKGEGLDNDMKVTEPVNINLSDSRRWSWRYYQTQITCCGCGLFKGDGD